MAVDIQLKVDVNVLRQTADVIQKQKDIINNSFNDIDRTVMSLGYNWQGESADLFQDKMQEMCEQAESLINILNEYVNDLSEIAGGYQTKEEKLINENEMLSVEEIFG